MANPLFDHLLAPHIGSAAPFLYLPDGGRISFGDFLTQSAQFAEVIRNTGLKPGDRLAVQIEKSPQALAVYAACIITGVIFLPLNTAYSATEISHFLTDSEARMLLCNPANAGVLEPVTSASGAKVFTLGAHGNGSFIDAAIGQSAQFKVAPRSEDDLTAFLYTSGTTGRSNGAMLSHKTLLSNAQTLTKSWKFSARDILLHALPIFHSHGLFVASNITLIAGSSMMFLSKFDADQVISQMTRCTTMMGVPTFYTHLLEHPDFDAGLSAHMRLFISGSAPMLPETHTLFEAKTGHKVLEYYGMSETY